MDSTEFILAEGEIDRAVPALAAGGEVRLTGKDLRPGEPETDLGDLGAVVAGKLLADAL